MSKDSDKSPSSKGGKSKDVPTKQKREFSAGKRKTVANAKAKTTDTKQKSAGKNPPSEGSPSASGESFPTSGDSGSSGSSSSSESGDSD